MENVYIIGSGGFAREVAWLVEEINAVDAHWNMLGFIDDFKPELFGTKINGYAVLGGWEYLQSAPGGKLVIAIGNGRVRQKILQEMNGKYKFATLIHPATRYSKSVQFGEGSIICAGNIFTTNISVGRHVIVNLSCTIGHDVILNDFCTLLPGSNVSGQVSIGGRTTIGTGASIIEGIAIGSDVMLGAGSVVVKNIPDKCTAVGIPAKPIKFHEQNL